MPVVQLALRDLRPMHLAGIGCTGDSLTPSTLCYVSSSREACERVDGDTAFKKVKSNAEKQGNVVTVARFCGNRPVSKDVVSYLRSLPEPTTYSRRVQVASPETLGLLRVATIDVTGLQLDQDMKRTVIETHAQARDAAKKLHVVLQRLADFSAAPQPSADAAAASAEKAVRSEVRRINKTLREVQTLPEKSYYLEQGGGAESDLGDMQTTIAKSTREIARLSLMKLAWVAIAEEVRAWTTDLITESLGNDHARMFAEMLKSLDAPPPAEAHVPDIETAAEYLQCVEAVQKYTTDTLLPYLRVARPVAYVDPPPALRQHQHWQTSRTTLLGCDAPEGSTVFAADGALGGGKEQPGSFARLVAQVEKAVSVEDLESEGKELLFAALAARSKRGGLLPRAGQRYDAPKKASLARAGVAVCTNECPFAFFAPRAVRSQAWMRWALLPREGVAFVTSTHCGHTQHVVHDLATATRDAARASRDVVLGGSAGDVAKTLVHVTIDTAKKLASLFESKLDGVQVMLGPVILRTFETNGSPQTTQAGGDSPKQYAARLMCAYQGDETRPVACFAFPEVEVQRMLEQHGERDAPLAAQAKLAPQLALHGRVRVPDVAAGKPEDWVLDATVPDDDPSVARYCSVYGEDAMCGVRCLLLPNQQRLLGILTVANEAVAGEGMVPLGAHWQTPPVFVLQQLQ